MILITGATGHIGNVLARQLVQRGERVRALLLPGEDRSPLAGLPLEIVEGDVLDLPSLQAAFAGVRRAYHLAGVISIMPGRDRRVEQVNLQGTRNVLQAARGARLERLLYTSSIHAIARAPHGVTIDENIPFDADHALSAYDRSKALATLEVLQAVQGGLEAVIACPTGVIGPYDYRGSEMGRLIESWMHAKVALCVEGAYDFVDVRDVAHGMRLACEQGRSGENYILSGERIHLASLMAMTRELIGAGLRGVRVPAWLANLGAPFAPLYYRLSGEKPLFTPYALATVHSNSVISHAKASRELGYQPRLLRQSLQDAVRWLSERRQPALMPA